MALYAVTYGGDAIFGLAVETTEMPNPIALQISEFPGLNGQLALALGSRGRSIEVRGVLVDVSPSALQADIDLIESYADGIARTLTGTMGQSWPNVIFPGRVIAKRPYPTPTGWCVEYSATFMGLT